jgi:hypothetical protein
MSQNLGWGQKLGGLVKNWKRRYFVLSGQTLGYYRREGSGLKGSINLTDVTQVANMSPPEDKRISISTPSRVWQIRQIEGNVDQWVTAIRAASPKIFQPSTVHPLKRSNTTNTAPSPTSPPFRPRHLQVSQSDLRQPHL